MAQRFRYNLRHGCTDCGRSRRIAVPRKLFMEIYSLKIVVEELNDAGDYRYLATSPDLPI